MPLRGIFLSGIVASIVVVGLAPGGAAFAASASTTTGGSRLHATLTHDRRLEGRRGSSLGLEALGVTGSYGYGDDYPAYGSRAYAQGSASSRGSSRGVLTEGRAAAVDEPSGYPSWEGPNPYESPGSTYGRQTSDYGPGVEYASPVSPYRWAYSSEDFPGTEFMRDR